ncbi:hypothetical protein PSDVSF_14600 [Pseudodesulfovibrio sediminis]|uniref:F5/8 type C domain-containing protein n=2 Tax=Pseudodesulfovibrio sediminis TaxID=2810563 RepID=A0ABM7P5S3_9BACT|nr:hypothetical protein PSDVSF_14600 [Pseudodesulfovibrio sediminis]
MDVNVTVSSFKVDLKFQYTADHLMDGDPTTAWAGGGISSGVGQWIELRFAVPLRVGNLGIYNGHQGEGQFEKFRRIRSGHIIYSDGTESPFWLRDESGEQKINCIPKPTKSIRIVVDEVFPEGASVAKIKLAVSEIKLYLDLTPRSDDVNGGQEPLYIPNQPPAVEAEPVPDEMVSLLKQFYVKQTTMADDYHLLFAPHVRDKHDFQYEVFKEMQRQRGTYSILKTAEVDTSGLGFETVFIQKDVAEIRVFGSYRIKVADIDQNMEEDSVFTLMKGDEGWLIVELEGEGDF